MFVLGVLFIVSGYRSGRQRAVPLGGEAGMADPA
jgi:hypothetical protein